MKCVEESERRPISSLVENPLFVIESKCKGNGGYRLIRIKFNLYFIYKYIFFINIYLIVGFFISLNLITAYMDFNPPPPTPKKMLKTTK